MPDTALPSSSPAGVPLQGTGETIVRNPIPDAALPDADASKYDVDFAYLGPSNGDGAQKDGSAPQKPEKVESHTPEEKTPEFAVPPVAFKVDTQTPNESETTKVETPAARSFTQDEVAAIQSAKDIEIAKFKTIVDEKDKELVLLAQTKTALEDLNKNPYAFVARYFPQLAKQVDPRQLVVEQLRKEFGEEIDTYDASQAYIPESPAYKIRAREEEIVRGIERSQLEAERQRTDGERERTALLESSKQAVMKEYGLDSNTFEKEIVEWGKTQQFDYKALARLKYYDWAIKRAVDDALDRTKREAGAPLPASIAKAGGGDTPPVPEHLKELRDEFGDI